MMSRSRMVRTVLTLAVVLATATSARALTFETPSLTPVPGGYLKCTATANSKTQITVTATILGDGGSDVTEFSGSWRVTNPDGYYSEEYAGSFNEVARSCKVVTSGVRRKNVEVSLTAYDENGNETVTVNAR